MLKNFFRQKKKQMRNQKILDRADCLLPWMVGKNFLVHTGKTFMQLEVVGLRLFKKAGDFVLTRKIPIHKTKTKKR